MTDSVDTSTLPPDLKALIDKAVADALAANQPAPPRELTPAEKATAALAAAEAAERGDHAFPSGSGGVHAALFAVLHVLVEKVFPPESEQPTQAQGTTESAN